MADKEVRLIDKDKLIKKIKAEIDAQAWSRMCMPADSLLEIIEDFEEEAQPDNGWISVEDRLPDKSQKVLVFYKALGQENNIHNDVMATNWRTKKGDFIPCDGYKVTHWQPLPKPPKGEQL